MKATTVKEQLISGGLIPVIRAFNAQQAIAAAGALVDGGVNALEIAFTTPGALRSIEAVAEKYGDAVLVGAGTVLDAETCRAAILAGSRFIVSPALNLSVIAMAKRYSVVSAPGALTPTEILTAWEQGADFVKVFPCDTVGGAAYIKAVKAPLPHIDLVPTGGVTLTTAEQYLKAGASALGVGSDLVGRNDCEQGNWTGIRDKAAKFVEAVARARSLATAR